jgi:putative addiction module killer protein
MVEVREYLDRGGHSPFAAWSDRLNREAAAKVAAALARMQEGNFSNAKGVGAGVYEYKIDFGPGYRIYFGKDEGRTTRNGKGQKGDCNGFDTRLQGDNTGTRKTRSRVSQGASARGNRKLSFR